jgi:hypothetical protein
VKQKTVRVVTIPLIACMLIASILFDLDLTSAIVCHSLQLKEEFDALHPTDKTLKVEWAKHKDSVLQLASHRSSARDLVIQLTDEYDKGMCFVTISFQFDVVNRVSTHPGKFWKVMELEYNFFQAWKVMEMRLGHEKSWNLVGKSWKISAI